MRISRFTTRLPKPNRRWFQFSLFTLLVMVTASALFFAWWRERHYAMPAVVVLDNSDPAFRGKTEYADKVRFLSASGRERFVLSGLNNCETVGAQRGVAIDPKRKRIYIRELVSNRIVALTSTGKEVFVVNGIDAGALAVDEQTGNLWCVTAGPGGTLFKGGIVVIDGKGKQVAKYGIGGVDIAYSPADETFWVVGQNVTKIDRHGRVVARGPSFPWAAVSVAPDPRDGSAWLVERNHPDVAGSVDRVLRVDPNGKVVKQHKIAGPYPTYPFSVACDSTGMAWIVSFGREVLRVPVVGKPLPSMQIPARAVTVGRRSGEVWVATDKEVLRLDDRGRIVTRYRLGSQSSQTWLSAL